MTRIKKKNRPHKNDFICDDRVDYIALGEKINSMTEEEFDAYCTELKEKQGKNNIPRSLGQ